jgi:hypothetical protein
MIFGGVKLLCSKLKSMGKEDKIYPNVVNTKKGIAQLNIPANPTLCLAIHPLNQIHPSVKVRGLIFTFSLCAELN